jgi:two-component system response regulator EvgA
MKPKILIVDDHPLISKGLGYFLIHHGYNAIGIHSKRRDLYEAICDLKPELIVLDIHMPDMNGIDILKVINNLNINIKVIIFTGLHNKLYQKICEAEGASGYLHKTQPMTVFLDAIKIVLQGGKFFGNSIYYNSPEAQVTDGFDDFMLNLLTRRELETMRLLMQGQSVKDISEQLGLSNKTVSTYKQRIMQKLGSNNLLEAIDTARAHQI